MRFPPKSTINSPNSCCDFLRPKYFLSVYRNRGRRLSENMQKLFSTGTNTCPINLFGCRARWRENRTIFNTPNPRLMNVSLLRENKLLHQERRGSRSSARGPSRQPSMASLRAHSPNSQGIERLCSEKLKPFPSK